ncbi:GL16226 [Drosophila persimilis]|uniref:GL16226 n=1 Tax=Drosophila persimilis TaxID=7234 RepID=B4HBK2_DROPE|nr:GL16226 [Drosophila persimilis]
MYNDSQAHNIFTDGSKLDKLVFQAEVILIWEALNCLQSVAVMSARINICSDSIDELARSGGGGSGTTVLLLSSSQQKKATTLGLGLSK